MGLLRVENLRSGYDSGEIIKGVSFSIEKGVFLGIIGPNGAGKTTLFRSITGVLPIRGGNIFYEDKDIRQIPLNRIAGQISVIPQLVEAPFAFTVEEFVFLGRYPYLGRFQPARRVDYDAVEKAMGLSDVSKLRDRKIQELSAGERQRVLLAQGFAQEPKLLFLDEPTAHLDITHQVQIMDILKKLNIETGLTVVVILHDLNLASEYCRELILLNDGKIFIKGAPEEVLTYQNIEDVYKTTVVVEKNPISSKPYVLLVSKNE